MLSLLLPNPRLNMSLAPLGKALSGEFIPTMAAIIKPVPKRKLVDNLT